MTQPSDDDVTSVSTPFRSGFVALVGRPNAGKSTLVNAILGERVSIITPKPQTTRNRIRAIHTLEGRGQIVFVDTPGIHLWQKKKLNQLMVEAALAAVADADVAILLIDALDALTGKGEVDPLELYILEAIGSLGTPIVLALNKIDLLERVDRLLPIIDAYGKQREFEAILPISALNAGEDVEKMVEFVLERLPEGAMLYPPELYTDQAERFMAAEMIREQIMLLTEKEIPYAAAVEIEEFKEEREAGSLRMRAVIHVERESQKGIIIGKKGAKLKEIGTRAREELERFFGKKVFLETFVRVEKEWSHHQRSLNRLGYKEP